MRGSHVQRRYWIFKSSRIDAKAIDKHRHFAGDIRPIFMAQLLDFFDMQMEAVSSWEMLVTIYQVKQSHFQENLNVSLFQTAQVAGLIWKSNLCFQARYHSPNNKAEI
jgi:hypothetical protein